MILRGVATQALLFSLISAISSGAMVYFIAKIIREMGDVFVVQFLFQLVGIPMLLIIFPVAATGSIRGLSGFALLVGLGILVTFAFTLLFHALEIGNLAIIAPLQNASVLIPVALAVLILHEVLSPLRSIGIIALVSGVVLLAVRLGSGLSLRNASLYRGVVPGVIARFGLGFYQFFTAISDRWNGWYYTSLIIRIVIPIVIGSMFVVQGRWREWRTIFSKAPWGLLLVAALFDVVGFSTFNFAASHYDVSYVTVIVSAAPVVSVMLAVILLKEKLDLHQKVGFVLAIAGVAALNI